MASDGCKAADKHAVVRLRGHAEAVAKKGAAGQGALRIARQNGHTKLFVAQKVNHLADEGTLADPGAAGNSDDSRSLGGSGELVRDVVNLIAAGRKAEDARQGPPI